MILRVVHEDGRQEDITLRGELRILHGNQLNRLVADDIEYFFTTNGLYDGWGCATRLSEPEAGRLLEAMEEGRLILDS